MQTPFYSEIKQNLNLYGSTEDPQKLKQSWQNDGAGGTSRETTEPYNKTVILSQTTHTSRIQ